MNFKTIAEVNMLLETVKKCKSDVWLSSSSGDQFNLKSPLCAYVGVASLLTEKGKELHLWCYNSEDMRIIDDFFKGHPYLLNE